MKQNLANQKQVAEFLGYSEAGLAQMRYRGIGPRFIKLGGRAVRYRWEDVEKWLDQQSRERTGTPAIR